jgi:hypothetical protein
MPDGYKREVLNVRLREYQQQIDEINKKLVARRQLNVTNEGEE